MSADSNGRITHDDHQGLDISYNVLNFPCRFYDVDAMTETSYTYLSDGSKRSVSTHDGLGKLYRGSFVYDGDLDVGSSVSLESVATPEGRLVSTTDGILGLWYAKDYLGNVRSVVDLASGVLEENDYLPFGTRIQDDNQPVISDNRWRYANKEEQSSLVGGSCTLIDFGARNYDPWSARWTTIDPMAQKYLGMSPYNYCAGNPVMYLDRNGEKWENPEDSLRLVRYAEAVQKELLEKKSTLESSYSEALEVGDKASLKKVKGQIKDVNERLGRIDKAIKDIVLLGSDTNTYRLSKGNGELCHVYQALF